MSVDTEKGLRLLEQVRDEPTGWPSVDLHKLLDLFGFTSDEPILTEEGWDVAFRYHPEHTDLNVVLDPCDEVWSGKTQHVINIIDVLRNRQQA